MSNLFLEGATHSLVASNTSIFLWFCKSDLGFNELKIKIVILEAQGENPFPHLLKFSKALWNSLA